MKAKYKLTNPRVTRTTGARDGSSIIIIYFTVNVSANMNAKYQML